MPLLGSRTVELHRASIEDLVQQGDNLGIRVEGKQNIRIVALTPYCKSALELPGSPQSQWGSVRTIESVIYCCRIPGWWSKTIPAGNSADCG